MCQSNHKDICLSPKQPLFLKKKKTSPILNDNIWVPC